MRCWRYVASVSRMLTRVDPMHDMCGAARCPEDWISKTADKVRSRNLAIGSVVAPVWPPTGGGSAMGGADERRKFQEQVRKG